MEIQELSSDTMGAHEGCWHPLTALTAQLLPLLPPRPIQQELMPPGKSSTKTNSQLTGLLTSSCGFNLTFLQTK